VPRNGRRELAPGESVKIDGLVVLRDCGARQGGQRRGAHPEGSTDHRLTLHAHRREAIGLPLVYGVPLHLKNTPLYASRGSYSSPGPSRSSKCRPLDSDRPP